MASIDVYKSLGPAIFDQWAYVIRRLSVTRYVKKILSQKFHSLESITQVCKERINAQNKQDAITYLEAVRFIDVNANDSKILVPVKDFVEYMINVAVAFKNSKTVKNKLFAIFDNIYKQMDFELQSEALLFESDVRVSLWDV